VSCASGGGGLGGAAEVEDGDRCSGGTIRRGGEGERWIGSSGVGCERSPPRNNMYLGQVRYGLFGLLENKHLRLGFWCNIDYVVAQIMIRDSP
jgi:hypothetical protein